MDCRSSAPFTSALSSPSSVRDAVFGPSGAVRAGALILRGERASLSESLELSKSALTLVSPYAASALSRSAPGASFLRRRVKSSENRVKISLGGAGSGGREREFEGQQRVHLICVSSTFPISASRFSACVSKRMTRSKMGQSRYGDFDSSASRSGSSSLTISSRAAFSPLGSPLNSVLIVTTFFSSAASIVRPILVR